MNEEERLIDAAARAVATSHGLAWDDLKPEGDGISREFCRSVVRDVVETISRPTPGMMADGWAKLKRAGLPRLGPGPGFEEAYAAALKRLLNPL